MSWQPDFRRQVLSSFDFFDIFLLINDFFKTTVNS